MRRESVTAFEVLPPKCMRGGAVVEDGCPRVDLPPPAQKPEQWTCLLRAGTFPPTLTSPRPPRTLAPLVRASLGSMSLEEIVGEDDSNAVYRDLPTLDEK